LKTAAAKLKRRWMDQSEDKFNWKWFQRIYLLVQWLHGYHTDLMVCIP
jgi:hypothetical protein